MNFLSKHILTILLVAIILLAFFMRLYKVEGNPPSLNWDEASIGYNAYSILKTGKDEWNIPFPVHFKSYGEYKLPAQIYASIPGIWIFGLNEFGIRITPVVYGTLTVLVCFFLSLEILQNKKASLFAALLLAISPWHLQLTRASFEASFACFWISLGVLFLLKGFKTSKFFSLSAVFFAVSVFTYNSARVFTPVFLLAIFMIYFRSFWKQKKAVIIALILFVVLLSPLIPFILSGDVRDRYKLVSITDDAGLIPRINENRGNSHFPQPLPRLIHNRVTYVALYFTEHYLAHFTPQFLFISGAPHKQHHVQGMGELYLFEAPFLLFGLYALFRQKLKYRFLLVSWILLAYIPVAITNDSIPHALRTVIVLPTYQIISGLGFVEIFKWIQKMGKQALITGSVMLALVVVISMSLYIHNYYILYPVAYSRDWQYGYKQVVGYINRHQNEYDAVVFTRHYGEPHIFTILFGQYDPAMFQHDPSLIRFETHDWVRVWHFAKYYFPDLGDPGTTYADILASGGVGLDIPKDKKILFVGKPGDFPTSAPVLETVNFLNGNPAFVITERK